MPNDSVTPVRCGRRPGRAVRHARPLAIACAALALGAGSAAAQGGTSQDPRVGLRAGLQDAGVAARHMELVVNRPRPQGFYDAADPGSFFFANSDLAFRGNYVFVGNFNGFQIYDIAEPRDPKLKVAVVCPGGQGDLSVHGNLLFMSVEMPNGRVDCGPGELTPQPSGDRFLGVRVFDISNIETPKQVAAVQTCRGSHTHTLVPDPRDASHVYLYVAGTIPARPIAELEGCSGLPPEQDPNTSHFRIEVIRVPLASPQDARVVSTPRIFADAEGNIAGLWRGGSHGEGTQTTALTDQCHDITVYPALGLAAGACSGNGILLDISDPANPRRIDEVVDPNFAYWHSATFNNDGTSVIFTDEWGGGMAARCRAVDPPEWGANAIFDLAGRELRLRSYYKLPAPQSESENCVAHNGSLVPVPGRDIKVQAWYQGGISVFDFTDTANPVEIAYFDRGPVSADLLLGGHWSAYWYNGLVYASEIGRGLDVLRLLPSDQLTQNELDAAALVRLDVFNAQTQPRLEWPAEYVVARAYVDQLRRGGRVPAARLTQLTAELARLEPLGDAAQRRTGLTALASDVAGLEREAAAGSADARRLAALGQTLRALAAR